MAHHFEIRQFDTINGNREINYMYHDGTLGGAIKVARTLIRSPADFARYSVEIKTYLKPPKASAPRSRKRKHQG